MPHICPSNSARASRRALGHRTDAICMRGQSNPTLTALRSLSRTLQAKIDACTREREPCTACTVRFPSQFAPSAHFVSSRWPDATRNSTSVTSLSRSVSYFSNSFSASSSDTPQSSACAARDSGVASKSVGQRSNKRANKNGAAAARTMYLMTSFFDNDPDPSVSISSKSALT